jgi:hypothetical protein
MYIVHLHKSMCILILYTICDLFRLSPIRLGTIRNKTCTSWFVSYIKWNYGCGNFIKQYPPAQKYECWRIINSWTNKTLLTYKFIFTIFQNYLIIFRRKFHFRNTGRWVTREFRKSFSWLLLSFIRFVIVTETS